MTEQTDLGNLDGDAGDNVEGSGHRDRDEPREPMPRTDGYAPLRTYAAIGDGRTVALVADDGRIDWFPVPNLDSRPVFAALLDGADGGCLELAPTQPHQVQRQYVVGTNVLETTYTTSTGTVRVTDSLSTGVAGRLPWTELARRVDGLSGTVPMAWTIRPGTVFNTASPWVQDTVHGPVLRVDGVTLSVRLLGETTCLADDQTITGAFSTTAGSRHTVGLVGTSHEPVFLPTPEAVDEGVDRTVENWRAWTRAFHYDGRWGKAVQRSALALKLLISAPSGAIAAAATTSLPESLAGGKNWDYRYSWLRDTAYAVDALIRFGLTEETHAAISWTLTTMRRSDMRVFYGLDGSLPGEHSFAQVPGWRGIGPVVDGNHAAEQLQLGVYGDLLGVVRGYVDAGNLLDAETGRQLATIADEACDAWHRVDAGMWELTDERHYTTSKLGCWQALTCAVHLAELGQIPGVPDRWRAEADRIRDWVETECWSEELGSYVMYPGSTDLDASILLHAMSGFDRGDRMSSTIDALRRELGDGPLLYRYTGMPQEEATFVACAFWGVAALAHVGRPDEAAEWMDALLEQSNDVGIWSEMIDASTGEFLGNLPQALSHLALVQAALAVGGDAG